MEDLTIRHTLTQVARGVLQSFGVILCFVGLGALAYGAQSLDAEPGPASGESAYAPGVSAISEQAPETWLVDGFNVLNAAMLRGAERRGFWRSEARQRLIDRASRLASRDPVCLVFDGQHPPEGEEADAERESAHDIPACLDLQVVFAPSADDWLLRHVRNAAEPARLVLVTADRSLADRARHAGARVVSPREFLARCDADEGAAV